MNEIDRSAAWGSRPDWRHAKSVDEKRLGLVLGYVGRSASDPRESCLDIQQPKFARNRSARFRAKGAGVRDLAKRDAMDLLCEVIAPEPDAVARRPSKNELGRPSLRGEQTPKSTNLKLIARAKRGRDTLECCHFLRRSCPASNSIVVGVEARITIPVSPNATRCLILRRTDFNRRLSVAVSHSAGESGGQPDRRNPGRKGPHRTAYTICHGEMAMMMTGWLHQDSVTD